MTDKDLERLDSGITAEHVNAPQFYAFHDRFAPDWQHNSEVNDAHAQVGRLVIDPDLLERATWEVEARTNFLHLSFYELDQWYTEGIMTPFLYQFVQTCRRRFSDLVQLDAQNYPNKEPLHDGYVQVGRYKPNPVTAWHVDTMTPNHPGKIDDKIPTDITYTMALLGGATTYSAQGHRRGDFTEAGYLLDPPESTATYSPKVVAVHHGAMAPHAAPDEAHARLFMNYRLYGAFKA